MESYRQAGLTPIPTDTLAPALDIAMARLRRGYRLLIFGEREPDKPMEMIRARFEISRPRWHGPSRWSTDDTTDTHMRRALMQDP